MRAYFGPALLAVCLVFSGCAQINPGGPPGLPDQPAPKLPISKVSAVAKTSWPAIVNEIDGALPRCGGTPPACQGTEQDGHFILQRENAWNVFGQIAGKDVGWEGSVWRWDPVNVQFNNSNFSATAHLLYHFKVGFTQYGEVASCGYGQPAREMYVGLSGPVRVMPDWYLDAQLSPNVTPGNLCQVTILNFNVTPALASATNGALQQFADKANSAVRTRSNMQAKAGAIWSALQQPIDLGQNSWLTINPNGVSVEQPRITDAGQYLSLPISLQAEPRIDIGGAPISIFPSPLPPIGNGPVPREFSVYLQAEMTHAELSRRLRELFVDKYYQISPKWPLNDAYVRIADIQVRSNGPQLVLEVTVDGATHGTLYFVGTPKFIKNTNGRVGGRVVINDLDYTVETKNVLIKLGDWLLHSRLRAQLRSAARWDVSRELQQAYIGLKGAMNRTISPDLKLSGSITRFGPGQIWIGSDGVHAFYAVKGHLDAVVTP
ncbi:MAG TPA: DUF4403 family protein [Pseudolabrys sp.]|jgi:hypothetical protein|uniref:DUF4403 family protein n=1 Tax=Pseudolabrys sp. TaxID=1960880 RepID=UPI002DDD527D|nr:DUF4403 family protein [Pseudolabrys sp.]HEV2628558.1 DUF4403 family protein [Pseudolabrys sp.]